MKSCCVKPTKLACSDQFWCFLKGAKNGFSQKQNKLFICIKEMCQNNLKQLKYNVYNSRPPEAIMVVKNKVLSHRDRGQLETLQGGEVWNLAWEPRVPRHHPCSVTFSHAGIGLASSRWPRRRGREAAPRRAASSSCSLPPLTPAANTHLASWACGYYNAVLWNVDTTEIEINAIWFKCQFLQEPVFQLQIIEAPFSKENSNPL